MRTLFFILSLILVFSCKKKEDKSISFYHWKANATLSQEKQNILEKCSTKKVYIHYFDVDTIHVESWKKENIFPEYVIKKIDPKFDNYTVIPTVFITNRVFQSSKLNTQKLVEQVTGLINQITDKYLKQSIDEIQIDCDWSASTKNQYFEFLALMKDKFDISCTIRLHQIKFQDKTGVPPVKKGTLMLYNMGDLKNKKQNSIIESNIVSQYINSESSYPLSLSIGLPIFSQTVVFNNKNEIRLINTTERKTLDNDVHFKKQDDLVYEVTKDTLYHGFYLSEGFLLKLEEATLEEVQTSYQLICNSKLSTNEVIVYHLDEKQISSLNFNELIKQL